MKTLLKCLKQYVVAVFIAVLAMGTYAQHYGLFVGINEYSSEYGASSLSGCVKDVTNFSTMCTTHGEWTNENIVKLTDSGATKSAVRGAITELAAKAVAGDTVLLFQSSHGGQIADKDVFLCTHDDDYYDYELAEDLSKFKSGVKLVVVVDACHSGGLFKSASKPKWNLASSVASHMKSVIAKKSAKGIKSDTISDSEIGWITAADYDEYSWDGNKGALFTTEMLDGWANGDADFDASGDVTFLELFDYAQFVAEDDGTVAQSLNDNVLESVVAGDVGGSTTFLIGDDKVLTGFLGPCPANLVIPDGVVAIVESAFDADFNDVENLASVTIPASVTSIGNYAFWGCSNLKKVEGGANLECVGYSAFNDTLFLYGADSWDEVWENEDYDNGYGLDLVYVGDFIVGKRGSLAEAWNDEYYGRNENWLWEYDLVIPEGTIGMANELFYELPITSVKIPGSVKSIPEYAFAFCRYLKNLAINEGVEEIEASAFECAGCEWYEDGITTLTIPSSVTKIGEYAFADFGYLKYVIGLDDTDDVHVDAFESTLYRYGWESPMLVIEGATVTGIEWETRFDDGCVTNGVLCIPQSVTNIADWALSGADGFHKVILPNTLLALGEGAFYGCDELEEVEIPARIKRIPEYAFAFCCNLKSLVINEGVEEIGASAFECAGCAWGLDTLVIPSSVTKIGEYAFAGFGYLKYVTGLDDTDDIHSDAFAWTPFIQGWEAPLLVIEDGVAIGFNWETRFDDGCITNGVLTIPEGVTNIAENAFSGEYGFNKVILPSSLRSIGEEAFWGCEELREVEGGANLERVGYSAFNDTLFLYGADSWDEVGYKEEYYGLDLVYIGNFIVGKRGYLEEAFDSEYMDGEYWIWEYELEIPEGTIGMADSLFSELPITSVTIPGSVKRIPECAFASCCHLKDLTINEDVEEIEASAFECAGCYYEDEGITTLTIPSSVTKIGEYAFADFGYLKYVIGLDDTDDVHSDAFAWTLYDEGWDAPVLMIEDGVVYGLEWETRFDDGCIINGVLNIPEGVTNIAENAFSGEDGFNKVILPSSLRSIGEEAFGGCEELREVEGGNNLERVGRDVFEETLFLYGADSWDEVYENEDYDNGYGLDLVYVADFIVGKRGSLEEAWDSEYEDEDGNWVWEYDLDIYEGTTGMADGLFSELPITSVTIPGSVKRIPECAFAVCCYLKNLTINEGVEEIEASAFECAGCEWYEDGITTLTIPSSVTEIGEYAFAWFGYLKYVTGLDDADEVHSDAFSGTPYVDGWEVPVLDIEDGVVYGLDWEIRFDDGCITNGALNIPEGITNIAEYAFCDEYAFNKVILPSSLRSIGDVAFGNCEELREVEGGVNIERVGYDAFHSTLFLYGVDSWDEVWENADYEAGYGLDLVYVGNFIVDIRGGLEEAWKDEYYDEDGNWIWEYDLVIPEGTTGMADGLFEFLPITSVTIPASVKRIPINAFVGNESMTSVTIAKGAQELEGGAFNYNISLTNIVIPSTVKRVGADAFGECVSLSDVKFKSEDTVFDATAFRVSIPVGEPDEFGYYNEWYKTCATNLNPLIFEKVGYGLVGWRTKAINGADATFEATFGATDLTPFASTNYYGKWVPDVNLGCTVYTNYWGYDEEDNWVELDVPEISTNWNGLVWSGYDVIPVVEANRYLVAFDSNGGSAVESIDVAFGSKYGELPVTERTGYTFAGWYNGETLVTSEAVAGVGNQSLVAKWTANKYTLTFDVAGGSSVDGVEVTFGSKYGELPVTERTGYTFAGWYNGEALVTSETVAGVGNQSLVAKWTANKYTLTFDVAGGSSVDGIELTFDSKYGELPIPERTGYTFAGWYNGETLVTSETVAGVGNQSLVAKWTANTYTIKYDSNGGEGSMLNQVLTYDVASILNPCAFDRSGYEFIGWALSPTSDSVAYQDRASVKNLISENDGSLTLYALWDRTTLWTPPVSDDGTSGGETPEVAGDEFTGEYAEVYDGYICDDDIVIGTIQAKTAKAKKDISKVTVSIQIAGEKKLTLKGEMAVEDAEFEAVAKDGRVLVLQFGLNGIFGGFDGYLIDGAKNFFSSKDKTEKAEAEDILESYLGAYTIVCDDGNLSITIAKKGKVTIKGVIGGNKVSAKAQALIGEDMICIPVIYSKKSVNLAFTIWLPLDSGEAEVVGLDNAIIGKAGTLKDGAKFIIDGDIGASIETEDSRTLELLPNNETITVSKSKWLVAGGIKAAKVAYKKGEFTITEGKKGAGIVNPSGLKLSYKSKDGSFTGSFTAYAIVKGKLKKHKATVEGILIGDVGYGTITIKKVGTWGVTIE